MNKINLAFVTVLALFASYIATDILWLLISPKVVESYTKPKAAKNPKNLVLVNNIFGGNKAQVKKPRVKVIPSKLNLDLIGILFKPKKSFAIIAPSSSHKLAKVYKVGDSIKSGVSVKEIGVDFVILQRGAGLEKLLYKRIGGKNSIVNHTIYTNNKNKLSTVQREILNEYRSEIVSNPRKLLSIVNVIPAFRNGKMLGVKVKPDKDKKTFNDLGFKSGDIVTKINNTLINDFSKFAKIRETIYRNTIFNLKIKRNNKTVDLSIQL